MNQYGYIYNDHTAYMPRKQLKVLDMYTQM